MGIRTKDVQAHGILPSSPFFAGYSTQISNHDEKNHKFSNPSPLAPKKLTNQSHQNPQDLHLVMTNFYLHLHHFLSCSSNIPTIRSLHSISSSSSLFSSNFIFHRFSFSSPPPPSFATLTPSSPTFSSAPTAQTPCRLSDPLSPSPSPSFYPLFLPLLPLLPSHHHLPRLQHPPATPILAMAVVGFAADASGFWRQLFGVGCNGSRCDGLRLQGMALAESTDYQWERLWLQGMAMVESADCQWERLWLQGMGTALLTGDRR